MSKDEKYRVLPFTADNLADALSNEYLLPEQVPVVKRNHFPYFLEYLGTGPGLEAKTIVIENKYVSKSYLNDFASYYALCFQPFSKYTKRIHFFQSEFSLRSFNAAILNPNGSAAKSIFSEVNYLGNIVAKPLPEAIIGPSILRTLKGHAARTYAIKKYHVNLFGRKLRVDSLIFQEQDSVVGACATAATWIALHKASKLFQSPMPAPNEITSSAGNLFLTSGRSFPNDGLDHHQIGNALQAVGLVSELRNNAPPFADMFDFKAFIYAYHRMGIPILLGIELDGVGMHLVTVTGYHIDDSTTTLPSTGPKLRGHLMDKLYLHDDQVGPFVSTPILTSDEGTTYYIETSWIKRNGINKITAKIDSARVLLHPKIRIRYEDVYKEVSTLNYILAVIYPEPEIIEWDIYLDFSNNYKTSFSKSIADRRLKKKVLFSSFPKQIWVATLSYDGTPVMDLVFDSTGIARSFYCHSINFHNTPDVELYRKFLGNRHWRDAIVHYLNNLYLELFESSLKDS